MSEQRKRFIEAMKLRGFTESTIQVYVLSVRRLAKFHGKPPLAITRDELRQYLLYLREEKKLGEEGYNGALAAIKLFYASLAPERDLSCFKHMRKRYKIPAVLTQEEVAKLLGAVKSLKYRTILALLYSTGLRVSECLGLRMRDFDRSRKVVKVNGKGNLERNIRLSEAARQLLRKYYRVYQPKDWLFEGNPKSKPLCTSAVRNVFRRALKAAGIPKKAHPHTLRHSYATHLLEQRCPLPAIQRLLGHKHLKSTSVYMHITPEMLDDIRNPLDCLMEKGKKGGKAHA